MAINIGIIVGVGIFRVPSDVAQILNSPSWILLAWLLGGGVMLLGSLCYAELSSRFPETGGTYIYLRECYGKGIGFLFGWAEFSIIRAASIAALAYIFAEYLREILALSPAGIKGVAIAIIMFSTVINVLGLRLGIGLQNVFKWHKNILPDGDDRPLFFLGSEGSASRSGARIHLEF